MSNNTETNIPQENSNDEQTKSELAGEEQFINEPKKDKKIPIARKRKRTINRNKSKTINKWKEYGSKWIEPMNIVSIILAFLTYLLFKQATRDSRTAEISSKAAQEAVYEQRYNDSLNRISDSIKFTNDTAYGNKKYIEDSINNRKNFEISKYVLQAQINSLKQTQKDFETENRPFIVYTNIRLDTPINNHNIHIDYILNNVGKFPAKISSNRGALNWGIDTSKMLVASSWKEHADKLFLSSGGNMQMWMDHNGFSDYQKKVFKDGITSLFVFLQTTYFSSVLSTEYSSYSVIKISYVNGKLDYSTIENKQE